MPIYNISHACMKTTFPRNRPQRLRHNILNIIAHISQRVHGCYIYTTIPAIAIRHDVSYTIANFSSTIYHTWSHDTCKIRFNLKIQTIGMGIIFPMPAGRRSQAMKKIVTGHLIGMTQRVFFSQKGCGKRIGRSIQTASFKSLHKSQVDIYIVIKAATTIVPFFNFTRSPRHHYRIRNHSRQIAELCRTSIRTADNLTGPSTFYFIKQSIF